MPERPTPKREMSDEEAAARGYKTFDPRDPKEAHLLRQLGIPYEEIVRIRNNAIVAGKKGPYRGSGKAFRAPLFGHDEETGEYYLLRPDGDMPFSSKSAPYRGMVKPLGTYTPGKDPATTQRTETVVSRKSSGGSVKKYAKGGSVRGGGCEMKGKTKGKFV